MITWPEAEMTYNILLAQIREGRIERTLALITGIAGLMSAGEVAEEHYRGSFGQAVMYSPVICCLLVSLAGFLTAAWPPAEVALTWTSIILLADSAVGFGFHIRGIARKPGGWFKNPVFNIVMGPPIFAPLLLSLSAVLGLVTASLTPEDSGHVVAAPALVQIHFWLLLTTGVSAVLNGFEALYSHYKARFASRSQWIPVVYAPILAGLAFLNLAYPLLDYLFAASLLAIAIGTLGFVFHVQGIACRYRSKGNFIYSVVYGPPPFAPLLFAASGFLGILATQLGGYNV